MKFLCDNCKAKYQIADEKLQGRAVQMKCRKCGHLIEVPSLGPAATPAPAGAASPAAPASKRAVVAAQPAPGADVARPAPARPAPARPAPARPAPAPARVAPAPARPAPARAAPAPARGPAPAPAQAPGPGAGLAGAFARTVQEKEVNAAIEVLSAGASEEWYVGINGVPLGPVRLAVLRQKATQNAINEESLVWREGFDEWLPLGQFPELVKLVQEAREHAVPALASGQSQRISTLPQAPVSRAARQGAGGTDRFAQMQMGAGGAVEPTAAVPQTAAGIDPFGISSAGPVLAGVTPPAAGAARHDDVMADPFAQPRPEAAAAGPAQRPSAFPEMIARPSVVDEVAHGVRKQVRLHPAAVAFIGLLGVFGGVLITIWLTGGKTTPQAPPTVQIVTVAAPATQAPTAPPNSSAIALADVAATGDPTRPAATSGGTQPRASDPARKEEPKSNAPATPMNVGLDTGGGLAGPNVGGPSGGQANSTLPQLEQADIQRVVSSNVGFVRRQCWEPALATRSSNAPPSAKVSVMVTIGPDGRVQSANASGGSGYPDLASCVASRVRGWKFPPSSSSSTANIPFVFAAQ